MTSMSQVSFRCIYQLTIHSSLPFLFAGEKKLKTGEKMVPRRVVRDGLLGVSVCTSSFPLGFTGLLGPVMVSEQKKMRNIQHQENADSQHSYS